MPRDSDGMAPKAHRIATTHPEIDDQHTLYTTCTTVIDQVPDEDQAHDPDADPEEAFLPTRIRFLDRFDRRDAVTGRVERADTADLPDTTSHAVLLIRFEDTLVVPPTYHDGSNPIESRYGVVFVSDPDSLPETATPLRGVHHIDAQTGDSVGKFGTVLGIEIDAPEPEEEEQ